jgi:nicotinate-nucleotide pyrophosphorylase (carboxylating)
VTAGLLSELRAAGLDPSGVCATVVGALAEDLPAEDVTTRATVPPGATGTADLIARQAGVVAGGSVAELVFRHVLGDGVSVSRPVPDGQPVRPGDVVLSVTGPVAGLLTAERPALNLLCHLSGIATRTRAWVDAVRGTPVTVRDTRKTTPGLRALEKYAVRCGGGANHRLSLSDQALVKENHVVAAGGVVPAYQAVLDRYPGLQVQVEVQTLDELRELLEVGADDVLLDNMTVAEVAEAVRLTGGRVRLEASGGLTLDRAAEIAATGVDSVAVGELTHSAPALDISMRLRQP